MKATKGKANPTAVNELLKKNWATEAATQAAQQVITPQNTMPDAARPLHPAVLDYLRIGLSIHVGARTAEGGPQPTGRSPSRWRTITGCRCCCPPPRPTPCSRPCVRCRWWPSCCSQPTTHNTVQIKGRDAVKADAAAWLHRMEHKQRFGKSDPSASMRTLPRPGWTSAPDRQAQRDLSLPRGLEPEPRARCRTAHGVVRMSAPAITSAAFAACSKA